MIGTEQLNINPSFCYLILTLLLCVRIGSSMQICQDWGYYIAWKFCSNQSTFLSFNFCIFNCRINKKKSKKIHKILIVLFLHENIRMHIICTCDEQFKKEIKCLDLFIYSRPWYRKRNNRFILHQNEFLIWYWNERHSREKIHA